MTFRAKTCRQAHHRQPTKPTPAERSSSTSASAWWSSSALLILAGAAVASYYGDHFAPLATVNGQGISKDDYRDPRRASRRSASTTSRRGSAASSRPTRSTATSATAQLRPHRPGAPEPRHPTIEDLIDAKLKAQLAAAEGRHGHRPADRPSMLDEGATTPEARHAWVIGVKPEVSDGRDRTQRRAEGDGQGQGRAGARRPQGRQDLGAVAAKYKDRRLLQQGRRDRLDQRGRHVPGRAVRRRRSSRTAVGKSPTSSRATTASSASAASPRSSPKTVDAAFEQKIKDAGVNIGRLPQGDRADAISKALTTSSSRPWSASRRPAPRQRDLHPARHRPDAGRWRRGPGPPHPVLAQRRPAGGRRRSPRPTPRGQGRGRGRRRLRQAAWQDPSKFAGPRQDRQRRHGHRGRRRAAALLHQAQPRPGLRRRGLPGRPQEGPDPGRRSSRPSAGTSSSSSTAGQQPSDRMDAIAAEAAKPGADFAAIAKANSEDHGPRTTAATSAGSRRTSSTRPARSRSSRRRSAA